MKNSIADITPGESWACQFKVETWIDKQGAWYDTSSLSAGDPVTDAEPGEYQGFGVIVKRDVNAQLVEIADVGSPGKTWTVPWANCWDIDQVEWVTNPEEDHPPSE